ETLERTIERGRELGLAHAFFRVQGVIFNTFANSALGKGAFASPVFGIEGRWAGAASAPAQYLESAWALMPLESPALQEVVDVMREIHQGARANSWKSFC